eukprot:scaffold442_cov397-Prasinococcus_capsulatus_cf.AAC.57
MLGGAGNDGLFQGLGKGKIVGGPGVDVLAGGTVLKGGLGDDFLYTCGTANVVDNTVAEINEQEDAEPLSIVDIASKLGHTREAAKLTGWTAVGTWVAG